MWRPRRIRVSGPLHLWGADLTILFVLGFFPVSVLGIVDYHGSRLLAFEPLTRPTSAAIAEVFQRVIQEHGAPQRLLTDNGSVFSAPPLAQLLAANNITHVRTRPAHPWTNGRIERIFRTAKSTLRDLFWIIASRRQLTRLCSDFLLWYNRDRPHSSFGGKTPDEVFFAKPSQPSLGPISYFDGRLNWYRFG